MRRAARYDGFFPVNLESADQLAEIVARVGALRKEAGKAPGEPYEVIAEISRVPLREALGTPPPEPWDGVHVAPLA